MSDAVVQVNVSKARRRQSVNFISKEQKQVLSSSLKVKQLSNNSPQHITHNNSTPQSLVHSLSPSDLSNINVNLKNINIDNQSKRSHHTHRSHSHSKYVLLIRMISLLDKQHQLTSFKDLSRTFHLWRNNRVSISVRTDSESSNRRYLVLFDENESLRSDLKQSIYKHNQLAFTFKYSAFARIVIMLLKHRLQTQIRHSFDKWFYISNWLKEQQRLQQSLVKLDLGTKHINREIEARRQIELQNSELKKSIFFITFFYKWKVQALHSTLASERKTNSNQMKLLYEEIKKMNSYASWSNRQESKLLENALDRGSRANDLLIKIVKHIDSSNIK